MSISREPALHLHLAVWRLRRRRTMKSSMNTQSLDGDILIARGWPAGPLVGSALEYARARMETGASLESVLRELDDVRRAPDAFCEEGNVCAKLAHDVQRWIDTQTAKPIGVRDEPM